MHRLLLAAVLACVPGCKKEKPAGDERRSGSGAGPTSPAGRVGAPQPFPVVAADGAIGPPGKVTLIDAADDGSWVALCQHEPSEQPRIVLGEGPGLAINRLIARGAQDLLVNATGFLVHIDATARTQRKLGALAPGAIDGPSRRLVHGRDGYLVIHDPGVDARELRIPDGAAVGAVTMRHKRWAEVGLGTLQGRLDSVSCQGWIAPPSFYQDRATIDLDPSGVEAADRIGPTLGITTAGEVTLDGQVVIGPECNATVVAALATPPRVLAICKNADDLVVGPDFVRVIRDYIDEGGQGDPSISASLLLGQRLVCFRAACVDLVSGAYLDTNDDLILADDTMLVRKQGSGLLVQRLSPDALSPAPPASTIALPRVVQAVTVDTATGRRHAGTAPVAPHRIDRAGRWMLYGRYIIDLQDAALVATLSEDAIAIDHLGRVLVPTAPGIGPLRWKKP